MVTLCLLSLLLHLSRRSKILIELYPTNTYECSSICNVARLRCTLCRMHVRHTRQAFPTAQARFGSQPRGISGQPDKDKLEVQLQLPRSRLYLCAPVSYSSSIIMPLACQHSAWSSMELTLTESKIWPRPEETCTLSETVIIISTSADPSLPACQNILLEIGRLIRFIVTCFQNLISSHWPRKAYPKTGGNLMHNGKSDRIIWLLANTI